MFQRGMRTVLGAQTGEGKTTLALQAVSCLMEGRPFLNEEWRPLNGALRTLVVDLEQGEETLKLRLREAGLDTAERVDILWEPNGIAIDARPEDRAMVEDILTDGHYDLVLLDPLYQSHLGSGNDEQVAAATMRVIDEWARRFRCSFVIPMHARKPGTDDQARKFTKHDIAGVATWLRNAEFVMGLQMRSAGFSHLHFFKDRMGFGPPPNSYWGLDFTRADGFSRNFMEDKTAAAKAMKVLVSREEGASWEELAAVQGARSKDSDIGAGSVRAIITKCDEREGRYYLKRPKSRKQASEGQSDDQGALM
jgi:hypothetical protein